MTLARRFRLYGDDEFRAQIRMEAAERLRDYASTSYSSLTPATAASRIDHKLRLDYASKFWADVEGELDKIVLIAASNININQVDLDPETDELSVTDQRIRGQVDSAIDALAELVLKAPGETDPTA